MLKSINYENVHLLPSLFKERADVNRGYLMELKNDALLQNHYVEAGIILPGLQVVDDPVTSYLHWGWEAPTCQLRGHFLGHFMSAAAITVAMNGDRELKAKLENIVDELERCQKLNGGKWIGPIPEKYFKKLEKNDYIWSPQYTMHKTLLGLLHTYIYAKNEKALEILSGACDWYLEWTEDMQTKNPHAVYAGEEGGMLEVWATLFELTNDARYQTLAERYSHPSMFRKLEEGMDALTNCHANASIPWAHGAAKMYEVTGEEKWLERTELFWNCAVNERESYCTGGQGAGEYWVPPHMNGQFLCDRNQEFCTVYNMVRLAEYLFKFTGKAVYGDYIEKNLYNGFLAQQNKYTGMPTYFLPLKSGSKKKWGSKTHDFWCCHGTMVQSQTIYPTLCYYEDEENNRLVVNQYIPSEVKWKNVTVTQNVDMKYYNDQAFFDENDDSQMSRWLMKFEVSAEKETEFTLSLRLPEWVKGSPVVTVNGISAEIASKSVDGACDTGSESGDLEKDGMARVNIADGYINITKKWNRDMIRVYFPARLTLDSLPDRPEMAAVIEGPIVLAGLCREDKGLDIAGGSLDEVLSPSVEHTYSTFPWKQSSYTTRKQKENFEFIPLYDVVDEEYTVYHTIIQ